MLYYIQIKQGAKQQEEEKMKKYNKSEIMSAAWRIYKNNKARGNETTFASCLSLSWKNAKKAVKAHDFWIPKSCIAIA